MKKTGWNDPLSKPEYVGWFERYLGKNDILWSWWDGVEFLYKKDCGSSLFRELPWRGLTKPYKGWKK